MAGAEPLAVTMVGILIIRIGEEGERAAVCCTFFLLGGQMSKVKRPMKRLSGTFRIFGAGVQLEHTCGQALCSPPKIGGQVCSIIV